MTRCTAAVDTIIGILECQRDGGRDHPPPHAYLRWRADYPQDQPSALFVWYDNQPGYGSIPVTRLNRPLPNPPEAP